MRETIVRPDAANSDFWLQIRKCRCLCHGDKDAKQIQQILITSICNFNNGLMEVTRQ